MRCRWLTLALVVVCISQSACSGDPAKDEKDAITTASGLKYIDLKQGDGAEAKKGTIVHVHYTGWLKNGKKFESSLDDGKPYVFKLPGRVIAGWNEGIPGMKVGGKRKLIIPPELAYGKNVDPDGPIPPNATLIFEVELLKVE